MSKYIFFMIVFLSIKISVAQNKFELVDSTLYKNELIIKNATGKKFVLLNEKEKKYVMIKWPNGWQSVGILVNSKENGHWLLFDRKGILRKDIFFSNGEANQVTEFDKRGKLIYKTNFTVNF